MQGKNAHYQICLAFIRDNNIDIVSLKEKRDYHLFACLFVLTVLPGCCSAPPL